ncbi:Cof-type HAD-IIB family hydrolase [Priestia flexa]|uniref:Cof-type HAD-IIB family hydrolase n=1 Tax=Priestia flexa TaxID=86664 RepID=UPI0024903564|nr:Cof-type HAD-IIB family hydrolase [Priestia flexa]
MDKPSIKLIALDMDGTLLNTEGEISQGNQKAIAQAEEKGIHVVLSTGRSRPTSIEFAESLKLSSYIINVNGSEIWDGEGNLIERTTLQPDYIQEMWDLKQKHKLTFWAVTSEKVWRDEFPTDITNHEWLKFGYDIHDDDTRKLVLDTLTKNKNLEITNSSPTNLEINALGINKAKALRTVCERLNLSMNEVMAMGDSLNDIAMITEAGVGVAMGNAQDVVKEAADWITKTNDQDGVAEAIYHWALK